MNDYWEENNIKKPQQVVVCAACKLDGIIFAGARHFDKIMIQQIKAVNEEGRWWSTEEQGFIDQFGDFLTRAEAKKITIEAGQIDLNKCEDYTILFSEDLY